MPESVQRFHFGLPALLLLPLWVSPLFFSSIFIREQFRSESPGMAAFINMLACTAAYAAFFTARSRRRSYEQGRAGRRHVLPAARAGALFGVLFMVQIVVPWQTAIVFAQVRRQGFSLAALVTTTASWFFEIAAMAGLLGLFGVFLGAFGGSLVGLFFDWRFSRRLAQHDKASEMI